MSRLVLTVLSLLWLTISPIVPSPESVLLSTFASAAGWKKDQGACWWEIKIFLKSKGKYTYKECKTSYKGTYAYTILWTGCIEQDQHDFILYHEDSNLICWKAMEKAYTANSKKSRATKKFSGEPSFELHYILGRGKSLHFDFFVKGFDIPQNCSAKKIYLHLPASKGNADNPTSLDYDLYVQKGSNDVVISRKILDAGCAQKDFQWTWKREKSFGGGDNARYLIHVHDVDVQVSVIRHTGNTP